MKNLHRIISILVLTIVFTSCSRGDQSSDSYTHNASIRFGWIPSASFAGEIAGAKLFAEKYDLNLKMEAGGPGQNAIQMVLTGQNTFGTIAADEILSAIDKGADLVILGVINYHSPGAFVSLADSDINTPFDFEGKRVGLLPFGSTTLLYESMIGKNSINRRSIIEITISPDLRPFLDRQYDVHPVFAYDETVTLELQNIDYNLILPSEYGVNFRGPCYFARRETVEKNPDLVKAFIYSMADGWDYAINNPDNAVTLLKDFSPEINIDRERIVLEKAIPFYTAYRNQPLNSDIDSWNDMILELVNLRVLSGHVEVEDVIYLEFIQGYYAEKRRGED